MKKIKYSVLLAALLLSQLAGAGERPALGLDRFAAMTGAQRETMIDRIRAGGFEAFAAFLHGEQETIRIAGTRRDLPEHREYLAFIDRVAAQHNAAAAGLFWYTDRKAALAHAAQSGRPVICLRLLGKLSEEYSCANSRFFRAALYADPTVAKKLRENFVLCWESERDIPVMTIEFGDGRKIVQTITGNSAHYAMTLEGKVLDALPGLYTPAAFKDWLDRMHHLNHGCRKRPADADGRIAAYHRERLQAIEASWREDLAWVAEHGGGLVKTIAAGHPSPEELRELDAYWEAAVLRDRNDPELSAESRQLILGEGRPVRPNALLASALSATKAFVETPVMKRMRLFRQNIMVDTLRNEHLMHLRIHRGLASRSDFRQDLGTLNRFVYDQLFQTPAGDPWLGLLPDDRYFGLGGGGASLPVANTAE